MQKRNAPVAGCQSASRGMTKTMPGYISAGFSGTGSMSLFASYSARHFLYVPHCVSAMLTRQSPYCTVYVFSLPEFRRAKPDE